MWLLITMRSILAFMVSGEFPNLCQCCMQSIVGLFLSARVKKLTQIDTNFWHIRIGLPWSLNSRFGIHVFSPNNELMCRALHGQRLSKIQLMKTGKANRWGKFCTYWLINLRKLEFIIYLRSIRYFNKPKDILPSIH